MASCYICELIKSGKYTLYKDEEAVVLLDPNPVTAGHIIIAPLQHYADQSLVPDYVLEHLAGLVQKSAKALQESVAAGGINLIIKNGKMAGQEYPHFTVNLLARQDNDGLNLGWEPKKADHDELSKTFLLLSEKTKNIGDFEKRKKPPVELSNNKEKKAEDNYLIKHLQRIP